MLRWAMFTGAAIVAAWFGLSWVQARDLGRAQEITSSSKLTAGAAHEVASLLGTAGTLNPDRAIDITRAQLYEREHRPILAVTTLERVTSVEPENLEAWRELSIAAAALPSSPRRTRLAESAFKHELALVKIHK